MKNENEQINNQQTQELIEVFIDKFEDVRKSGNAYFLRNNKEGKDINYIVAFSADGKTSDYVIDIHGTKLHNIVPNDPAVIKGFTTYEGAKEFVEEYFQLAKARKAEAYKRMKENPSDDNAKTAYKIIKGSYALAKASMCVVYVELQEVITEEQYRQRLAEEPLR